MEQHPIPRQITTFEFKLIGFMTLKQFIYLLIFIPTAFIVFRLFPIPILNLLLAAVVAFFGIALAFMPINDRPLDVFIKNFLKRLTSPTQYSYSKTNRPPDFLKGVKKGADPAQYLDAKKKLEEYLNLKNPKQEEAEKPKEAPQSQNFTFLDQKKVESLRRRPDEDEKKPYLVGEVKNSKQTPLPGVLVYVRNQEGKPVRLLKTNPSGVFATYKPLPKGEYTFEAKDPKGQFFFDTIRKNLEDQSPQPIELYSKEMI